MKVFERIRDIRKTKGLSQQEVADKMGIDRAQYSRIETAKASPTLNSLERIAEALGVDLADLFTDDRSYDINSYDSSIVDKVRLIEELDEEYKKSIYAFIDLAISNKQLRDTLSSALAI